jgi:hypothetical protein
MDRPLVHYKPMPEVTHNVRCLNGNAHRLTAANLAAVTCPICLDENANKEFWNEMEKRKHNIFYRHNQLY